MTQLPDPESPVILWHSDPVGPEQAVMLAGWNLGGGVVELRRVEDGPVGGSNGDGHGSGGEHRWTTIRPVDQHAESLTFVIPRDWSRGIYLCRVRHHDWTSQPVRLNAPDVWWTQADQGRAAAPSGWVRVFGKCLGEDASARLELLELSGRRVPLRVEILDRCAVAGHLPEQLEPGEYRLRVHNGFGGESGWIDAGSVHVAARVVGPELVINVTDFGARPCTGEDCTPAVVQAIERLQAAGGGVLYFPRGRYRIDGRLRSGMWIDHPLRIPPGVTLRGEAMELVSLYWPDRPQPLASLIEGGDDFAVENLTLYAQGRHRNAISGNSRVRIHRVRIRANAYFALDAVGKPHRGRNVQEFSTEMGAAIELTGQDVQVSECDVVHTGRGIVLKNVRHAIIARNTLRTGCGYVQFNGGEAVIFEHNHCSGAHLTATGGGLTLFFGATAAKHYYFAHNRIEHIYGGDRETLTLDGHGTAYVGHVLPGDQPNQWKLTRPAEFANRGRDAISDPHGATLYVLAGRGVGQWRTIQSLDGQTLTLDRPFDIQPDPQSILYIGRFNGRHLIVGNDVRDSGYLLQLFPPNFNCLVVDNHARRAGRLISMAWAGYNRLLMQKRVGPSWFNQFIDNQVVEGNGWGGETHGRFTNSNAGESGLLIWATLSSWVHDENNDEHFRPLQKAELPELLNAVTAAELYVSRWQVVRRQKCHNNSSIRVRGAVRDVLIEDCQVGHNQRGLIVESAETGADLAPSTPRNILIRKNHFESVDRPLSGDAMTAALVDPVSDEPAKTSPAVDRSRETDRRRSGRKTEVN